MIEYTVKVYDNGNKFWYLNGKRHREDGPAIEYAGYKEWYLNGKRHREDGPALEWANGDKAWYLNGKRHREDGPALEYANDHKEWYLNGKRVTAAEVMCPNHTITIDGKEIRISHESFEELKEQLR